MKGMQTMTQAVEEAPTRPDQPRTSFRQFEPVTISELKTELAKTASTVETTDLPLSEIEFHLGDDIPHYKIKGDVVQASPTSVRAWGDFFGIPSPFFKKIEKDLGVAKQGEMLQWFHDTSSAIGVRLAYSDKGVQQISSPGKSIIQPVQLLNVAERVLGGPDAEIVRLVDTAEQFAFDLHVPVTSDYGIGGDVAKGIEVGDISAGGLTFAYNRKRNLAPEVGSYWYRFWCTNGARVRDDGLRVDARGNSVDEVLAELEAQAERAFSRTERQMTHFYNLREQRVDDPERTLIALARDYNIPDRSLTQLLRLAATDALPDNPSRFDLLNLITNHANDPAIRNDGGRLVLEGAGGAVVEDDSARCGHCHSRLVH
jgi:hypothetical protein